MATCATRSAARACWVEVKRDDRGEGSRPNNRPSVTPPHVASETQCIAPGVRAR